MIPASSMHWMEGELLNSSSNVPLPVSQIAYLAAHPTHLPLQALAGNFVVQPFGSSTSQSLGSLPFQVNAYALTYFS